MRFATSIAFFVSTGALLLVLSAADAARGNHAVERSSRNPAQTSDVRFDLWAVSTRHLDCECRTPVLNPTYVVDQLDSELGWVRSDVQVLSDQDPGVLTVLYVHGNRVDAETALAKGQNVVAGLSAGGDHPRRVRFIIWTWPSDRIPGQIQDVREKARRTYCEGYYLANFLAGLNPRQSLSLIGYSFGSRVTVSSLHFLSEDFSGAGPEHIRVTLMAAAVAQEAVDSYGLWSASWWNIDELLVLVNPRDPVLKRFWVLEPSRHLRAIGAFGLRSMMDTVRVEQFDVSDSVGRTHREEAYFQSLDVMELVAPFVLEGR